MRKRAILLLSLLLVGLLTVAFITERLPAEGTPGAPGIIGDPYFPGPGNGGYDALYYELIVDVDIENATIESRATMQTRATQNLSRFNLDFAEMTTHSLTVNGTEATFERDERELMITPSQVLTEGDVFETVVMDSLYDMLPRRGLRIGRPRRTQSV
jgi:hypothetical protein